MLCTFSDFALIKAASYGFELRPSGDLFADACPPDFFKGFADKASDPMIVMDDTGVRAALAIVPWTYSLVAYRDGRAIISFDNDPDEFGHLIMGTQAAVLELLLERASDTQALSSRVRYDQTLARKEAG